MSEAARLTLRDHFFVFVFALIVLAPGISSIPPTDRDESRYAVASTQMLTSGDLVDIRFQERPRYLQPAGIYWLQAASVSVLSSPEAREIWAYRVPSLLGAVIAVLLTGGAGAMLFGRKAGIAAAVLLAVSFSLNFEARTAKTDAALLASIAVAQFALLRLYLARERERLWAAVFWIALGIGAMLKGPIIVMIAAATIFAIAVADRSAAWLKRLHVLWGLPLFLLIVLPWYIAIGIVSHGDFYRAAVGVNLLGKVGASQQSHAGPPGYHLALFPFAFWPGALFAALAIPWVWRKRAEPSVRFLIAWIVPTWIIFEAVGTKLPHYVLPTYPAIACLAAGALFEPDASPASGRLRALARALWIIIWLFATLVITALAPLALWKLAGHVDPLAIVLASIALAAGIAALVFTLRQKPERAIGCAAAAALVAWVNTLAIAAPRLEPIWLTPRIEQAAAAAAPCPDTRLVSTPFIEPSLVFLHGPARTVLAESASEAADAFAASPSCTLALIGAEERPDFLAGMQAHALSVRDVGVVRGRNYSNGDELTLTLYAVTR